MNTKDGGPAFPIAGTNWKDKDGNLCGRNADDGMTLRDYFAAAALAGMSYASDYSKGPCNSAIAERAFHIADAMLAEREKVKS